MNKHNKLKGYAPVLLMAVLAVVLGILLLFGVLDLNQLLALVSHDPVLAVLVALALFVLKGVSVVIIYNILVVAVSLVFPLPAALAVNAVGLAVSLSVSYYVGRRTDPSDLNAMLERHPKIKRFFTASQELGFASCFAIHMLGISMEILGVLFGMMRTNFWTYLISSWLAIYPGTICFTILGNRLDFRSPVFWVFLVINVVLIAYALFYCHKRLAAPAEPSPDDNAAEETKPDSEP